MAGLVQNIDKRNAALANILAGIEGEVLTPQAAADIQAPVTIAPVQTPVAPVAPILPPEVTGAQPIPEGAAPTVSIPVAGAPAVAPEVLPAEGEGLFGLNPAQFTALFGGLGEALAPPDTWQSRLGAFAKSLGKGKIVGKLTGTDVKGSELEGKDMEGVMIPAPPRPKETAKKSALNKITEDELSNTLLGE